MIHIVFNEYEIELLQKVIELDPSLEGEVIQIRDEFAVGPLENIDTEEGWQARENWWRDLLKGTPYGESIVGTFDDRVTVWELKQKLDADENQHIWIWMGQNQHDVCGYYWLIGQLKEYQGRIMVLYLNNLPFINEKGQIFYPSFLGEIQPKEFLKAKKLARPVTSSEFEVDPDEWKRLVKESSTVRMLEGGKKIISTDATYYDSEILKNVSTDWQKASRVLSNTINKMKIKTGDVFLMWRIRTMIESGRVEVTGDTSKGWKEFDIRLPGKKELETAASETNEA